MQDRIAEDRAMCCSNYLDDDVLREWRKIGARSSREFGDSHNKIVVLVDVLMKFHNRLPLYLDAIDAARENHEGCEAGRAAGIIAHPCKVCDALAAIQERKP